jgi:alpha-aminoadipate carrier protein LysW
MYMGNTSIHSEVDAVRHQRTKVAPQKRTQRSLSFSNKEDRERFCLPLSLSNYRRGESINMDTTTLTAHCPECDAAINLQGLLVNEIIYCPDCNAELEVLNLEQPTVALAPQVEEDWGE